MFTTVYQNTDAVITGKSAISSSNNGNAPTTPSLPASLADAGASAAVGRDRSGRHLGHRPAGRPKRQGHLERRRAGTGLQLLDPPAQHFNPLTAHKRPFPTSPNEIDIDASTASKHDYKVGDEIGVVARGPVERFQIAGTVKIGGVSSLGGATISVFTLAKAQELFNKVGKYDSISVAAKHGYSPQQVVNQIKPLLGPSAQVKTGQQQAQQATNDTSGFLNIFQDFLLAFGGIALFVGSFVIANTLSITIAQRTRELATLRTLGATRRQVLRSVLVEAFVIGTLASIVGLFLGLLLAKALNSLLVSFGINLPAGGDRVQDADDRDLAARRDHHHDDRGGPAGAARDAGRTDRRGARGLDAAAVAVGQVRLVRSRWDRHRRGRADAHRAAGQRIVDRAAPARAGHRGGRAVHRLLDARAEAGAARSCGCSAGRRRRSAVSAGKLAQGNSARNPARTASTASALMIGLALVTLVGVLAAGLRTGFKNSRRQGVRRRLRDHGHQQLLADQPVAPSRRCGASPE